MSEWKEYKLGELCNFQSGTVFPNSYQGGVSGDYPFIKVSDMNLPGNERIIRYANNWINKKTCKELQAKIHPKNATVFAKTGIALTFNRRRLLKQPSIIDNNMMSAVAGDNITPLFLYYLLCTIDFNYIVSGTAVPYININELKNIDVKIPSLSEQRAIASVLSSIDDKIDLLHRENKTLEAMAETLFRKWFIEEAKDDWEHTKLGEVVTITYGKNLPIKKLLRSGYPVFGGNGQIGFYNKYLYVEPQVLVSCRGEASGKVNISLPRSFITNNSLILVRDKRKEITFEYLKYHSLNYDFTLHVSGSAQPQITIDSLYDAAFLIPPVDLINKFTEIVRGYEEKRTNNLKQIHTLEKLRDTLLPKLMSGEVRVKYEEEEMASCRA